MRVVTLALLVSIAAASCWFAAGAAAQGSLPAGRPVLDESVADGSPLTRQREGGTPYDPNQPLFPYALEIERPLSPPGSGLIESPPEYSPARGVLFMFIQNHWHTVCVDLVAALTSDPLQDDIAYVVVKNTSQQSYATNLFTAAGADMSKVEFIIKNGESIWIRDYGPHFIWQDGTLAIVDSHYYPTRALDNFTPTELTDLGAFTIPSHSMGVYYSGGNFQPGPNRMAVVSALLNLDNPASQGFTPELLEQLFNQFQGIDTLHIFPQLPWTVDGTGHIDMWMYLVGENDVIISEFLPGSNPTAIQITNDAVTYMQALGFTVQRTPAWNVGDVHYTYTNGFRVNDRILVPKYGEGNPSYLDEDATALAAWQAAAGPGVEIIPIDSYSIIPAYGALHCICMQVPRYVDPLPSARVLWPQGGEVIRGGTTRTIRWEASDTDNAPLAQVDLYCSLDDGATYEHIAATADTGSYEWAVPAVRAAKARVKVVATAADNDQGEAESTDAFKITLAQQFVYDFEFGGGINKYGYGHQTLNWSGYVDKNRRPVSSHIPDLVSDAYERITDSDATGGDSDTNRYVSPAVGASYESTHTFEFTVAQDPDRILAMEVLWEGYADNCTQAELYVWDYTAQQWGDGRGVAGQNRYLDSFAGNRDAVLSGTILSDFGRYIGPGGQMTFLLYGERAADESFHDCLTLTVTTRWHEWQGPNGPVDLW